jgi:hypothetical protein
MLPLTPTIHRLVHEPPRVRPVPDAQVLATSPARRPRLWGTVAPPSALLQRRRAIDAECSVEARPSG